MTEEDRKGIAWECRKNIMSALRDVDDMDILRRIYISVLDAKGNYCDIATGRETGHEVLVCGTGTEATGKDESAGHPYISEKYVPAVQNRQDNRIQGLQRASGGTCAGIDLQP